MNKNFRVVVLVLLIAVVVLGAYVLLKKREEKPATRINSFVECAEAGYPVEETYPARCRLPDGRVFTQDISDNNDKSDLIRVFSPEPQASISSAEKVKVSGEARGQWYFEASFPIEVKDNSGQVIGSGIAQAQGGWMTIDFVPFMAEIIIKDNYVGPAEIILHRDNPSGLPENNDELVVPIVLTKSSPSNESKGHEELSEGVGQGSSPQPIADDKNSTPPTTRGGCYIGGCSRQMCSDDPNVITTCEWREEYACYRQATCERQASGQCGWTETESYKQCLSGLNRRGNFVSIK